MHLLNLAACRGNDPGQRIEEVNRRKEAIETGDPRLVHTDLHRVIMSLPIRTSKRVEADQRVGGRKTIIVTAIITPVITTLEEAEVEIMRRKTEIDRAMEMTLVTRKTGIQGRKIHKPKGVAVEAVAATEMKVEVKDIIHRRGDTTGIDHQTERVTTIRPLPPIATTRISLSRVVMADAARRTPIATTTIEMHRRTASRHTTGEAVTARVAKMAAEAGTEVAAAITTAIVMTVIAQVATARTTIATGKTVVEAAAVSAGTSER